MGGVNVDLLVTLAAFWGARGATPFQADDWADDLVLAAVGWTSWQAFLGARCRTSVTPLES